MFNTEWTLLVIALFAGGVFSERTGDTWLLNIAQGPIRGYKDPESGFYTFYNIPYATAPTGTDKFKAPLAPPTWTQTFDAVDRNIVCPQPGSFSNMQEDCLVANVIVPDTDVTDLSVLVSVHGGAYQYGFGDGEVPITLVRSNKLILVTFNYRLGAHGFLCLGTEGIPGNAGLKDQVALLRWVKANIASFGGNPDDVTVMGCSAGAGSVDVLTLSQTTTGLFKRAVLSSGSVFGAVGVQQEPVVNAQRYAELLNFDNTADLAALEDFYKTATYEKLFSEHDVLVNENTNTALILAPCVERDVGEERVLEDAPINIIKNGDHHEVPILFGFANMEGLMRINAFDSWGDMMNEHFVDFIPAELHFDTEEEKEKVANTIKSFYFGEQPVSEATVLAYVQYFTDVMFGYPILKDLKTRMESRNDVIYLYEYSFVDEDSPSIPHTDEKGAEHCEQTMAILDVDETKITAEHKQMRAITQEFWLNFILSGSPWVEGSALVSWPPANASRTPHMSLGPTIQLKGILLEERLALWDDIYDKYYRAPTPPTDSAISFFISKVLIVSVLLFHALS